MVAETPALDRERAQAKVAAGLVQVRPPEDVHAVAVGEVEPQRVESRAQDRHTETSPVGRVLQGEEHALPARVAPQLGDLALHPDARQPREPVRHPTVEGRDGVDLAVSVLDRLDLHRGQWYARLEQDLDRKSTRLNSSHGYISYAV